MAYERSPAYRPGQTTAYKLSRTKVDLFVECPRCFWLDNRLKIKRVSGPPFTLNSAVDHLLKKEFDSLRQTGKQHPLQIKYGIDAKPCLHDKLNIWRENFKGVEYLHEPTNLLITGAIDDLWQDSKGNYIVLDYKSTSKAGKIDKLGTEKWHDQYRRQLAVYQWLLRGNGLSVSNTGYWVYANALKNRDGFDGKLEFELTLISEECDDSWIEPTLHKIKQTLEAEDMPKNSPDCEHCAYARARTALTLESLRPESKRLKNAV